jgi:hypothetical protein
MNNVLVIICALLAKRLFHGLFFVCKFIGTMYHHSMLRVNYSYGLSTEHFVLRWQSIGDSEVEVARGERWFALAGLLVTLGLFTGYLLYQWLQSLEENDEVFVGLSDDH